LNKLIALAMLALASIAWVPIEGTVYPWPIDCANGRLEDGYIAGPWDICIPGVITKETWYLDSPAHFSGMMSSYDPGVMPRTPKGYVGSVASMSCGDIGKTYWLRFAQGDPWLGPFLVQDCSQRNHLWGNVFYVRLAVEVDYRTALKYGFRREYVEVAVGSPPRHSLAIPIPLNEWYEPRMEFVEWRSVWPTPTPNS
jgi:hypothetical protein